MGPLDYRVKVDLSKHYRDVRRFSWIYVDCTNVMFISHVKQHIAEVFDVQEPFHLLLNGKEYLPPSEDVRILKENELIVVVPGSGINDSNALSMSIPLAGMPHSIMKRAVESRISSNMDYQEGNSKIHINIERKNSERLSNSLTGANVLNTSIGEIVRVVPEIEAASQSKGTDYKIIDNCSTMDPYDVLVHKRKRIRRKRSKNVTGTSLIDSIGDGPQSDYRKTKMVLLPVLSSGKHIHFDNADEIISTIVEKGANEPPAESVNADITMPNAALFENSKAGQLSTLLALGHSSTPLMFDNKKSNHKSENKPVESEMDVSKVKSYTDRKNIEQTQNRQHKGNNDFADVTEEPRDFSNLRLENYSSLEDFTKPDDIVAFKILRIGNEYTPEISDYIVARTISWCPKQLLYTFQILRGHLQFQSPLGKFSLPDDTTGSQLCDTFNANFSQLIQPRLIYRK